MANIKDFYYPDFNIYKSIDPRGIDTMSLCQIVMLYNQHRQGIQLFVEKKVSDILSATDIQDIKYEDVIFPARAIELYFEDKNIPTCLIGKLEDQAIHPFGTKNNKATITFLDRDGNVTDHIPEGIAYMVKINKENSEKVNIINYPKDRFEQWINTEECFPAPGYTKNDLIYTVESKAIFKLAVKILLYISIPEYRAIPINKDKLPREARPGVKNRPIRPTSKVIYVPPVVNINKETHHAETDTTRKPHFRRGHFRMLRDERYKEKIGKLIFVRPAMIHGGSMSDKLYVARKINEK